MKLDRDSRGPGVNATRRSAHRVRNGVTPEIVAPAMVVKKRPRKTKGSEPTNSEVSAVTARKRDAAATRARILDAAMEEFAVRGMPDARIEDVALRADTNRRMIYYYFGSKEGLYLAALEAVYAGLMNEERKIDVETLDPVEAIEELVRLKIDHYTTNPKFIAFLNMENLYRARYLKNSKRLADFKAPFTKIIARVLERGQRLGIFRADVDPVDLYISICALGYLYFSNQYTLGVIFGRDMIAPKLLKQRKTSICEMVISYLKYPNIDLHHEVKGRKK
ncbi:MAG: TetR family transcriptional regulator [Rhodopseudomonas sp.]|nr:TetR family transcriptional regulator [Rhodopseudomonas sp.]